MSETYEQFSLEQRAADAGRAVEEQRRHEAGYAAADARIRELMSARWEPRAEPAAQVALAADAPRVLAAGPRGEWARATIAGQLSSVVQPDVPGGDGREREAAREFMDRHEFVYERRPSMTEARAVVSRGRRDGSWISGTADELSKIFSLAGLPFAVISENQPLPPANAVVNQPVVRG